MALSLRREGIVYVETLVRPEAGTFANATTDYKFLTFGARPASHECTSEARVGMRRVLAPARLCTPLARGPSTPHSLWDPAT